MGETKTHKCSGIERKVARKTTGEGHYKRKMEEERKANDKDEYRNRREMKIVSECLGHKKGHVHQDHSHVH